MRKIYSWVFFGVLCLAGHLSKAQITSVSVSDDTPCPNQNFTVTFTGTGPNFRVDIGTSPGGVEVASIPTMTNSVPISQPFVQGTNLYVRVYDLSMGGFMDYAGNPLTVNFLPTAPTAITPASACSGTAFALGASGGAGTNASVFQFFQSDGVTPVPDTNNVTITSPTTFVVNQVDTACSYTSPSYSQTITLATAAAAIGGITETDNALADSGRICRTNAAFAPSNYTLTVSTPGSMGGGTLMWDVSTNGGAFANIPGATGLNTIDETIFGLTSTNTTYTFRAYISGACNPNNVNLDTTFTIRTHDQGVTGAGSLNFVVDGNTLVGGTDYYLCAGTHIVKTTPNTNLGTNPNGKLYLHDVTNAMTVNSAIAFEGGNDSLSFTITSGQALSGYALLYSDACETNPTGLIADAGAHSGIGVGVERSIGGATPSTAPTSVTTSVPSPVCTGTPVTFTANGGTLSPSTGVNARYEYSTNGGTTWTSTGVTNSIMLTILAPTTVIFRTADTCGTYSDPGATATVTLKTNSSGPDSVRTNATANVCMGTSVTFTAFGATLGTGAVYEYSLDAFATPGTATGNAGLDSFITLVINTPTTVSFRVSGDCNVDPASGYQNASVGVAANSVGVTAVTPSNLGPVCGPTSVTFTANGTRGDNALYQYSTNGGVSWNNTLNTGTDNFITLTVSANTTVDMRIFGGCNDVSAMTAGATVNFNSANTAPASLGASPSGDVCSGTTVLYTINGGVLGTGAVFEFSTDGFSTVAQSGAGNTFSTSVVSNTTVSARITGGCNDVSASVVSATTNVSVANVAPASVTPSSNPACLGSSVTFTANGGTLSTGGVPTAVYQFSTDGFTTIAQSSTSNTFTTAINGPTTVSVRITGGCNDVSATVVSSATVTTLPLPTSVVESTTPSGCENASGSIGLSATGGTGPYTFSIDNGSTFNASSTFTGLAAGSYPTRVRDDNGCVSAAVTAVVANTSGLTIAEEDIDITQNACFEGNNGVIAVTATGGTAPFTYAINSGAGFVNNNPATSGTFGGLAAGTYSIRVTDANLCTFIVSDLVINQPLTPMDLTVDFYSNLSCFGANDGRIENLVASGGAGGYTFSINGGPFTGQTTYTGLAAGNYVITVRDMAGCEQIFSFSIESPDLITAEVDILDFNSSTGYDIQLVVGGGTGSLVVRLDNGEFTPNTLFTDIDPGTHTYEVKDQNGCTIEGSFFLTDPDGIREMAALEQLHVFPNPFSNVLTIRGMSASSVEVTITDVYGKVVHLPVFEQGDQLILNTEGLAKGLYLVTLSIGEEKTVKKLIRE